MTNSLEAYNNQKRAQIDRLTSVFARRLAKILKEHTESHSKLMELTLLIGHTKIKIPDAGLEEKLESIFELHAMSVIKSAVSDGLRDIKPVKNLPEQLGKIDLKPWSAWAYNFPIELTFVALGETKLRDTVFERISKKMRKKIASYSIERARLEKKRYLSNLTAIFKNVAVSFFSDPDTEDTKEDVKDRVLDIINRSHQTDKSRAESIFRTETTNYFNTARIEYFKQNTDVDFVQVKTKMDNRVSKICEARHDYVIPLSQSSQRKLKPPFHVNCRCILKPLDTDLKRNREEVKKNLGSEFGEVGKTTSGESYEGKRKDPNTVYPLPKNWA